MNIKYKTLFNAGDTVYFINKLDKIESGIINNIILNFEIDATNTKTTLIYNVIKKNLFGENMGPFEFEESELYSDEAAANKDISNKYIIINMDYPGGPDVITNSNNELMIFRKMKSAEIYAKKICNNYKIIKI